MGREAMALFHARVFGTLILTEICPGMTELEVDTSDASLVVDPASTSTTEVCCGCRGSTGDSAHVDSLES